MTEENAVVVEVKEKETKVRSSFTMARDVMDTLKAKAVAEDSSVSALIERAVAEFLAK